MEVVCNRRRPSHLDAARGQRVDALTPGFDWSFDSAREADDLLGSVNSGIGSPRRRYPNGMISDLADGRFEICLYGGHVFLALPAGIGTAVVLNAKGDVHLVVRALIYSWSSSS